MATSAQPPNRFFVRGKSGATGWQAFSPVPAEMAVDIRALVLESPDFLSLEDGRVFRAAMPAGPDPNGSVLVATAEPGSVFIVTCPKETAHQELVAGVLTAGATMWRRPYADFCADFQARTGAALEDVVARRAGSAWSAERFRKETQDSLDRGQFPVLLIADGLKPVPDDIVTYLQSMNLAVTVFSYTTCRCGGVELILPGRIGVGEEEGAVTMESAKPDVPPASVAAPAAPTPAQPKEDNVRPAADSAPRVPEPEAQSPQSDVRSPAPGVLPARGEEMEDIIPPDFAWARAGTKPGVMADKRPPAPRGGPSKKEKGK